MKTNHRRKNPLGSGFNYSYLNFTKRIKNGLSASHEHGHKGSAREIREIKALRRRADRHKADAELKRELQ